MSAPERRGTLPSGLPSLSALPQHMTNLEFSSVNDSVDSNDSYQSQVPQQFYQSDNSVDASQDDRRAPAVEINTHVSATNRPTMSREFDGQLPLDIGSGHSQNGRSYAQQQNLPPTYSHGFGHGHNVNFPAHGLASSPPQYNVPGPRGAYASDPYAHFNVPNGMGNYSSRNAPYDNGYAQHNSMPLYNQYSGAGPNNHGTGLVNNRANQESFESRRDSEDRRNSHDSQNTGATGLTSMSSSGYIALPPPPMKSFNDENKHRCGGTTLSKPEVEEVDHVTPRRLNPILTTPKKIDGFAEGRVTKQNVSTYDQIEYPRTEDSEVTPRILRSRRGQNISEAEQVKNTTNWIEQIEITADAGALQAIEARIQSPQSPTPRSNAYTTPTRSAVYNDSQLVLSSGGRAMPVTIYTNDGHSAQYKRLTSGNGSKPSLEEALLPGNLPFEEYCRKVEPDNFGVVRIRNIPYNVSRQEIMAFLGRNARLVNENEHEPVHIVMERVTSKTLDCFVEFINFDEAVNAVQRFETNRVGGKGSRLGQRHVDVELSSQDELMKELFPKAKNVKWVGGRPEIIPKDPNDKYNSGFAGFISKEELIMLMKHVEAPQRSPFSKDCPQRPFECLISTIVKYPWYAVDAITLNDRIRITEATKELLRNLYARVNNYDNTRRESIHINSMLLKRVWKTCLLCKGFSPMFKDDIVYICNVETSYAQELGLIPNAHEWAPFWLIGPKPGVPMDVLNLYIDLIRDITTQARRKMSLAEQAAIGGGTATNDQNLFGDIRSLIRYPHNRTYYTLAQIAEVEWSGLEEALRRALTPALN